MDGYLVEVTDKCSQMGCCYEYGHHPFCGIELVAYAEEALSPSAVWDFSNVPTILEIWPYGGDQ